jgi:hypothetical protein
MDMCCRHLISAWRRPIEALFQRAWAWAFLLQHSFGFLLVAPDALRGEQCLVGGAEHASIRPQLGDGQLHVLLHPLDAGIDELAVTGIVAVEFIVVVFSTSKISRTPLASALHGLLCNMRKYAECDGWPRLLKVKKRSEGGRF